MELTRRGFLKGSAAACGAAAAAGMFSTGGWLSPAKAYAGIGPAGAEAAAAGNEHTACTYHQGHCGGMCPLKCTVRDGRLVKVEPNTCVDDRYETICLKGISEVQHIYGSHRIQTPLRRVGERGANEFEPISWDEAYDEIVERLTSLQKQHGRDCVMVGATTEASFPFLAPMLGAQTGGMGGIDNGTGNGLDPAIGHGGGYAYATGEARDWVNANMVLTVGSNFCESTLPQVRLFFEAKEAGAKMITVDPHFSTTASKSNEWIPITPGTDAALFLGMASAIVDNQWYDEAFMAAHTAFPYLVDTATGKLVRDHAEDPAAEEPETGEQNPFFVWDAAANARVPYASVANPALEGTFTEGGTSYKTVFTLFKENQKPHTLDWAAEKTGIPAERIEELARAYAQDGPASIALGWGGNDKMANADIAGHAAAMLAALTDNICKPGANIGVFVGGAWNGYTGDLAAWELPEDMTSADDEMAAYDMRTKQNKVRAFICCGDFFQQHYANMNATVEWAKSLDFIVSIDPYFTEGAKWADIVLPACTRFENEEEVGNLKVGYNQLVLQNKVIEPLFEARTDFRIQRDLAERLGAADALPKDSGEWVAAMLANSEDPYLNALTVDKINENHGAYPLEGIEVPRQAFPDLVFGTTSGRMDVYYDNLVDFGQALPTYEDPSEAYDGNPLRATYPLQLANVRSRFRIHNQFADASWIQQYYEPYVELNPAELDARGIAADDTVEVGNDRGSFQCRVKANPAVRPGSARMIEGASADYLASGNLQNVTNDTMVERGYELMTGPVIPFSDTLVEVKKA